MKSYRLDYVRHILLLMIILGILASGCSGDASNAQNESFRTILPIQDLNESIKLSKVDVEGFRDKNSFVIMVENHTESLVAFPKDYGIGLYQYKSDEWTEILNRMVYLTEENIIVRPKSSPLGFNQSHISFFPDLPDLKQPVSLRLAVIGNIQQPDGTLGEEVGAYIDFTWEP